MTQRQLWTQIFNLLNMRQAYQVMGGEMTYVSKARRAMQVSKSKKVHALANQLIALADWQDWRAS